MNDIRLDLGYDIDPYPTLADVLATRPELAERCATHGWFQESTGQAQLRRDVTEATAPRITVQALARAAGVTPRTIYGFIEGRTLQPANAIAVRHALEEVTVQESTVR